MPHIPVTPAPAASVLMLRDRPAGMEVFMVLRSAAMDFSTGALVFPGGKIDPDDHAPAWRRHATGVDGLSAAALAGRVAAIRETFEETNAVLARPRGETELVAPDRARDLVRRYRKAVHDGDTTLIEMVQAEDLELAADLLTPFANWITPEHSRRRFDVHFYLAPAPADHDPVHDGIEAVDSLWIRPRDALAEAAAGNRPILFPTRANLSKLGRTDTRTAAIAAAAADTVVPVMTRRIETPDGPVVQVPLGVDVDLDEFELSAAGFGYQFEKPAC